MVSKVDEEKREALRKSLETSSLPGTVRQVRLFLEHILELQSLMVEAEVSTDYFFDGVQIAQERNITVLGL